MTGLERIYSAFRQSAGQGRAALMPYFSLGFPTPEVSLAVVQAIAAAGADLIELGVPFSDPLADGPTIQRSTQIALEQGFSLRHSLEAARTLRAAGVTQPFLLMGYFNPMFSYGLERFVADAVATGVDGLIVPDLPYEEAGELEKLAEARGLALVYLLAPTSTPQRVAEICRRSRGFVYLVSLTGVTGARSQLPPDLAEFVARVREHAPTLPLAVGFGIGTPEQAAAVGQLADGVIVGSALIQAVEQAPDRPAQAAAEFVQSLAAALPGTRPPGASLPPRPAADLLQHADFPRDRSQHPAEPFLGC